MVWAGSLLDPNKANVPDGTLNTDGYYALAETKPMKPGRLILRRTSVKKDTDCAATV